VCLLCILVVIELYSLVFAQYPAIARGGHYAIWGGLALSVFISLLLFYPGLSSAQEIYPRLLVYFNCERIMLSSLVLFILILNALLAYFPVPLNRNTIYYLLGFSVYFVAKILCELLRAISGAGMTRLLGACVLIISLLCTIFWAIFLRRAGETQMVVVHPLGQNDRDRLFGQLSSLNTFLAKPAVRRQPI
jgi:hypothetical protein